MLSWSSPFEAKPFLCKRILSPTDLHSIQSCSREAILPLEREVARCQCPSCFKRNRGSGHGCGCLYRLRGLCRGLQKFIGDAFRIGKGGSVELASQGQPEKDSRVTNMVAAMDEAGFGNCTNQYECSAAAEADQRIHLQDESRLSIGQR